MEEGHPWPTDQRSARLWNFFNSGEDFFKIVEWPTYLRAMALKAHKNYRERYRLYLFFVANGLDPVLAYYWVNARDYAEGGLKFEPYDASANSQMNAQIKATHEGRIFRRANWFDMTLGRVVHGPEV